MGLGYGWWLWLWKQISPEVDSRRVEEILAEARHSLPTPGILDVGQSAARQDVDHPRA